MPTRRRWTGVALVASAALFASAGAHAHAGHTDRAPWDACAELELDGACSWQDAAHSTYSGTCRSVGGALMCVRNQPIEPAPAEGSGADAPD